MSWNKKYIVLIMFTTVVSYISALLMDFFKKKKRILLVFTLVASLGTLFFFKYFNFVSGAIMRLFHSFALPLHPITLKFMLPVGISFYTFQTLSYVIDVYKGKVRAERHFGKYAAFITFFPQLVAGPIERTENLLPQICKRHFFQYSQAVYGLKLMAWGFFKKIVIADNLAVYVDLIYSDIYSYKGFVLIVASIFFAFQIYCDFSGYSDIAVGVAKLFGIDLMTNFKSPYFSSTIKEFWSRWHISLSTWFRDYVYIPLGGNRKGKYRTYLNLIFTFLVSGLWHGANWTFILWGGVHGTLQVIENILHKQIKNNNRDKHLLKKIFSIGIVFLSVCICWIFFRAETVQESVYVFRHMFDGIGKIEDYIRLGYQNLQMSKWDMLVIPISLIILSIYDFVSLKEDPILLTGKMPLAFRWCAYYFLLFAIILMGNFGSAQFVYFQF